NRVAIGVGNLQAQRSFGASQGHWQTVVVGIRDVLEGEYFAQSWRECPQSVRIWKATDFGAITGCFQVDEPGGACRDGVAFYKKARAVESGAGGRSNRLDGLKLAGKRWSQPLQERVIGSVHGRQLIDLKFGRQMRSFATDISNTSSQIASELALHAQVPLLNIRPHCSGGDRGYVRRKGQRSRTAAICSDTRIAAGEVLNDIEDTRRRAGGIADGVCRGGASFERSRVCFVACAVFEENSVAGAD